MSASGRRTPVEFGTLDNYRASDAERRMAWKLAGLHLGNGRKGLEPRRTPRLDGGWRPAGSLLWGIARHVVFKEKHKDALEKVSRGVEQITLQEALNYHPKVVIGVFDMSKIAVTGSVFAQLLTWRSVRLAVADSVDEEPHVDAPELRFAKKYGAI